MKRSQNRKRRNANNVTISRSHSIGYGIDNYLVFLCANSGVCGEELFKGGSCYVDLTIKSVDYTKEKKNVRLS